jgi:hypothetical protein
MSYLLAEPLGRKLLKAGLAPKDSRLIDLVISAQGGLIAKFEVYVTAEDLAKWADVLKEFADEHTK